MDRKSRLESTARDSRQAELPIFLPAASEHRAREVYSVGAVAALVLFGVALGVSLGVSLALVVLH